MLFASRSSAFSRSSSRLLSSPCGERRKKDSSIILASQFQSTLPVRGATERGTCLFKCGNISIHAPRAGSDCKNWRNFHFHKISIHAPRAGSDRHRPRREEVRVQISIHAPRAGSDRIKKTAHSGQADFNPRSPCGERPRKGGYTSR